MLIPRDVYTQVVYPEIEASGIPLGKAIIQYEVRSYFDTRNLTTVKGYLVTCTQRLILPNPTPFEVPVSQVTSFLKYPGLVSAAIAVSDASHTLETISLVNYTPRTVNAAVTANQSIAQGTGTSISKDYTSGSSTSQTNSYSVSGSVGFTGDVPSGSVGADSGQSSTSETSTSQTSGNVSSHDTQLSNSDGTTIKDWGCYATVDLEDQTPTWTWTQEYPWNILYFNGPGASSSSYVQLPQFVQERLYDGTVVYPPSELSLFGIDVTAKATWHLVPKAPFTGVEPISFVHTLTYSAASHWYDSNSGKLEASLDTYQPVTVTSPTLDLPALALHPLAMRSGRAAIVGFLPNKFDAPPTSASATFAITSDTEDLLVRGSGFTGVLSTDFSHGAVTMGLYFKVLDPTADLSLSIKHWTQNNTAVQLSIAINGNAPFVKFADAPETSSGGDNVTTVALRNRDFTSVDYCDWLQPGLNWIGITFTVANAAPTPYYQVLAVALE